MSEVESDKVVTGEGQEPVCTGEDQEPVETTLDAYISQLEGENDRHLYIIARLEKEVSELKLTGWNERRARKLRKLETFYTLFVNVMTPLTTPTSSSTLYDPNLPGKIIARLLELARQELKYLPENPWDEMVKAKSEA